MPSVSFVLTPMRMDAQTLSFGLNLNGQSAAYDHGPRIGQQFTWPGEGGTNQVSYRFEPTPSSGRSGVSKAGPWAWFRILDETGGLQPGPLPEIFIARFALDDRWSEWEVQAMSAFNPFNLRELRTFRCPSQL